MMEKLSMLSAPWFCRRVISFPSAAWPVCERVEEDTPFVDNGVQMGYRVANTAVGKLEFVATPRAAVSLVFGGSKFPVV